MALVTPRIRERPGVSVRPNRDACELGHLRLPRRHGGTDTVLARCVQNRLTTLLLMLVERIKSDLSRTCAP